MKKIMLPVLALTLLLALPFRAMALIIVPNSGLEELSTASFGGTGIPNSKVAVTTISGGPVLGLSAHSRYGLPPTVTNNGAGTFYAEAGAYPSSGPAYQPGFARWNFDFYVAGLQAGQTLKFYYDTDAAFGNDVLTFLGPIPGEVPLWQDSWNLGMTFLGGATFDEFASGQYGFALVAYNSNGTAIGQSAILVNVGSVPDGSATVALVGLGLFGVGLLSRFLRRN